MKPDLLEQFGVSPSFIANQKQKEKDSKDKTTISNLEISAAFRKLSYLSIVKWSNSAYPPASTKMKLFEIAQIQFIVTRYTEESMQSVYGSILLPYISFQHHALIYRLFENAHIRHNPANFQDIGV